MEDTTLPAATARQPLFAAAPFAMLRAPVLPAETFLELAAQARPSPMPGSQAEADSDSETRCHRTLLELAAAPEIELALGVGSLSLLEGLARVHKGERSSRTERTFSRLLRYLIRMSTRPTPFGLFAGVTRVSFQDETALSLHAPVVGQIRTRPDMNWLLSVAQRIEQSPEVVGDLHVQTNQTVYAAGGRVFLPSADIYGQADERAISLRETPVVRHALGLAKQPMPYGELRREILGAFSQATSQQVDRLLQQLWEHHFLTSDLHPPLTCATPAFYLLEKLADLPGAALQREQLQEVLQSAQEIDRRGTGAELCHIRELMSLQEKLVPELKELPLQIDTSLHLQASALGNEIGEAAAQAAELLLRLGRFPRGLPHLQEYRHEFLERYGSEAEVPVLDLLGAESGLDAPSTYAFPPRGSLFRTRQAPADWRNRDLALCALVTRAAHAACLEVELDEALLQQFGQWHPQPEEAPRSLELYLQVEAASQAALNGGDWRIVISPTCGSAAAGRTFGRFYDLLGEGTLEALRHLTAEEEARSPGIIFAELSYFPKRARAANVALRPALRSYEIAVGTTPSVPLDHVIPLSDLVVGVRDNRFYVRSLALGKDVVACQSHMLNVQAAPNVCRFLLELAQDGYACLTPFDWGAAASAPLLPRLAHNRIVLNPAQWNLSAGTITPSGAGRERDRWFNGLQRWRAEWDVPRYVYLTEADNRLLLDLEHPVFANELRLALEKAPGPGQAMLQEMLPDFDHLWLEDERGGRYLSEIVVPLLRAATPQADSRQTAGHRWTYAPRAIARSERTVFPGEAWSFLKLYLTPKQQNEFIAGPLRAMTRQLQEHGLIDRWFYVRYADPEPHLRLRFHARDEAAAAALTTTALAWCRDIGRQGLASRACLDTYEREVERYGGPQTIDALEDVFSLDSSITCALVSAQHSRQIELDPLDCLVLSLDLLLVAWGLTFSERLQWLQAMAGKADERKAFHGHGKFLCELLFPWKTPPDSDLALQREKVYALYAPHTAAIRGIADQVRARGEGGELWVPESKILTSLAHMHVNRLLGIEPTLEQRAYAFWRHTLESVRQRPGHQEG